MLATVHWKRGNEQAFPVACIPLPTLQLPWRTATLTPPCCCCARPSSARKEQKTIAKHHLRGLRPDIPDRRRPSRRLHVIGLIADYDAIPRPLAGGASGRRELAHKSPAGAARYRIAEKNAAAFLASVRPSQATAGQAATTFGFLTSSPTKPNQAPPPEEAPVAGEEAQKCSARPVQVAGAATITAAVRPAWVTTGRETATNRQNSSSTTSLGRAPAKSAVAVAGKRR